MKNIINYENFRYFAYSNDKLLKTDPKGICVEFWGLNVCGMQDEDNERAKKLAEAGIIFIIPYTNPWSWMNEKACERADVIIDMMAEHYGMKDPQVVSTGGSMGGLCSIVFCHYSRHNVVACVSNCPVCDLPYHYTERPDLPHTLFDAFYECDDLDAAMVAHSPLHLAAELPEIEYHIFHCDADQAVNIDKHSRRFIEAMKGRNITFDVIPGRGHCQLTDDMVAKYDQFIIDAVK